MTARPIALATQSATRRFHFDIPALLMFLLLRIGRLLRAGSCGPVWAEIWPKAPCRTPRTNHPLLPQIACAAANRICLFTPMCARQVLG